MKIGFVFDDSLDLMDGVQQYVRGVAEWLSIQGHDVHYLVGHTNRSDIKNIHSLSKTIRVKFNGNVVGTPLPASKPRIANLLAELKLDVLHVQMPYSPVLAGRVVAAADKKTAVIGTLHIYPNTKIEHRLNKLLKTINSKTLNRFDEILAVSSAAAEASHIKTHDIKVVPNPVDLDNFMGIANNTKKQNKIIFLGRLVQRKGCMTLLKAINILVKENKLPNDWTVEIGGGGQLRMKLEEYVASQKLDTIVKFKGFIPESEKPGFIASSKIAVYPSTGGESFGIVLLEAMAANSVTLAGDNSGYKCVMGAELDSQVFSAKNEQALAMLILGYIETPKLVLESIRRQRLHVKQFDINVVGKSIEQYYQKALSSRDLVR
jgi:phosphatidylinositol alpha-mannosyltransferase